MAVDDGNILQMSGPVLLQGVHRQRLASVAYHHCLLLIYWLFNKDGLVSILYIYVSLFCK